MSFRVIKIDKMANVCLIRDAIAIAQWPGKQSYYKSLWIPKCLQIKYAFFVTNIISIKTLYKHSVALNARKWKQIWLGVERSQKRATG